MWSLGQEGALEEGTAAHSSILAWRISRTEAPGRLRPQGCKESDTAEATGHAQKGGTIRGRFFQLLGGLRKWKPRGWIKDNGNALLNAKEHTQLDLAQGLMASGRGPGPPKGGGGAHSWALCRGYMLCARLQRQKSICLKVEETCLSLPQIWMKKKKETSNSLVQRESDRKSQALPGIYG